MDLLKSAFVEMQQLYRTQIESLQIKTPTKIEDKNFSINKHNFIGIKELSKKLGLSKKRRKKFKKIAISMLKKGDFRFVEAKDEIWALKNANYSDFLKAIKG